MKNMVDISIYESCIRISLFLAEILPTFFMFHADIFNEFREYSWDKFIFDVPEENWFGRFTLKDIRTDFSEWEHLRECRSEGIIAGILNNVLI